MIDEKGRSYLECDCCGDVAAWGDKDGLFCSEQDIICGCLGMIEVDGSADPPRAYVAVELGCENCEHLTDDDAETSWDQI